MRNLLLGTLFRECPYAVPLFPLRDTRESDQEFLEFGLAYKRGMDGALESESDYKLRQVDYMTWFAALLRAGERASEFYRREGKAPAKVTDAADATAWSTAVTSENRAIGIDWAWVWLARMLNIKPRRISLAMLEAFLQIAGHDVRRAYPRQFPKLVDFFASAYSKHLPTGDPDVKSRLHDLLVTEKCANPPKGADY